MIYVALFSFAPILLAICRNAIDEVLALAQRKTPFGSSTLLRERVMTQSKVAKLRVHCDQLALSFTTRWPKCGIGPSLASRSHSRIEPRFCLPRPIPRTARERWRNLCTKIAGTTGIYMKNPLERHFRDVQVLKQHGFASESRYEAVGQVYLGLSPEWAPIWL